MLDARMAELHIDREHYAGTATCAATARCRMPDFGLGASPQKGGLMHIAEFRQ